MQEIDYLMHNVLDMIPNQYWLKQSVVIITETNRGHNY